MLPEYYYRWVQTAVCLMLVLGMVACTPTRPPQAQAQPLPPMAKSQTRLESTAAQPFLRIETGMHTAMITRIAVDQQERYLVTASDDKTARVWDLQTGKLLQILRPPIGEGNEGKLYAVAMSPDGNMVAVSGWTAPTNASEESKAVKIYLFDRASGHLTLQISGLPNAIHHLAYSLDGYYLAVALGGGNGIRIYRSVDWREVGKDTDYGDDSYWVEFDTLGRLVSTSLDGFIRLYDKDFHRIAKQAAPGGKQPFSARFSPDGSKIAVGFADSTAINVLSADTLALLTTPDTQGINTGNLMSVAWSQDGQWLYAGGIYDDGTGSNPILKWSQAGQGTYTALPAAQDSVLDIHTLSQNRLAFGAADPAWGLMDNTGRTLLGQQPLIVDHRDSSPNKLLLAEQGGIVEFQLKQAGKQQATRFDLNQRRWLLDVSKQTKLNPPRTNATGLNITNWEDNTKPQLNAQPLKLEPYEISRSLAIAPDGKRFLLGAEWWLRLFDKQGHQLWEMPIPGIAWAVNISGDGRWAVAALGDGTIRWYGLEDGQERLAFFPHADGKRWVLWTPEGFFDASPGAEELIGYHLNQGPDKEGQFVEVKQLYNLFYRPDLVAKRFQGDEQAIAQALATIGDVRQVLAGGLPPSLELLSPAEVTQTNPDFTLQFKVKDQGGGIGQVIYRINGKTFEGRSVGISVPGHDPLNRHFTLATGDNIIETVATNTKGVESRSIKSVVHVLQTQPKEVNLYVLALGIRNYKNQSLQLQFPDADANAIVKEFQQRGVGLFHSVQVKPLLNEQATLPNIQAAFEDWSGKVQPQDVFVLYLAGHGKALDGNYLFVPWEYENGSDLLNNSLNQDRLTKLLAKIPAQNSVILLDTCEAGAFKLDGREWEQQTANNRLARSTGRSILSATSDTDMALGGYKNHGVFTYALLEGLKKADINDNNQIELDELSIFVGNLVPKITKEQWNLEQKPMRLLQGSSFAIGMKPAD